MKKNLKKKKRSSDNNDTTKKLIGYIVILMKAHNVNVDILVAQRSVNAE